MRWVRSESKVNDIWLTFNIIRLYNDIHCCYGSQSASVSHPPPSSQNLWHNKMAERAHELHLCSLLLLLLLLLPIPLDRPIRHTPTFGLGVVVFNFRSFSRATPSQTESFLRCRNEHLWCRIFLSLQVWTWLFFCLPLPQQDGWSKRPRPSPDLPRGISSTSWSSTRLEDGIVARWKRILERCRQDGYPQDAPQTTTTANRAGPRKADKSLGRNVISILRSIYLSRLSTIQREFEFIPFVQNVVLGSTTGRLEFCLVWCEMQLARYD